MLKNTLKYIVKLYWAVNFRSSHLSKNLHGVYINASFLEHSLFQASYKIFTWIKPHNIITANYKYLLNVQLLVQNKLFSKSFFKPFPFFEYFSNHSGITEEKNQTLFPQKLTLFEI